MCGIAGALLTGASPRTADEAVGHMVDALVHRGPDDRGTLVVHGQGPSHLSLGHRRLAILDLSPAGHQPMTHAPSGNAISYNGEVYNHRALRAALTAGCAEPWASASDTEVLLRAYARWGRDCVHHLRGMFAFALWDAARQELFLARDRLGIKPLYTFSSPDGFLFSSETRALLASGLVPKRLDPVALEHYLAYQTVPAPRTMIEGVRMLAPGTWMVVDAQGRVTQQRYWDALDHPAQSDPVSPEDAARRLSELLREAVELHLVSDVPVGVFLSGGLDSSAIAALVRRAGHAPRTFSVGFGESAFDESPFARLVAEHVGAEHVEIRLSRDDLLEQVPDALAALDQPSGDAVNTYVVARAVREAGLTVALSGLGGDELFGGYPSFRRLDRWAPLLARWSRLPVWGRGLAAGLVRRMDGSARGAKVAAALESNGSLAALYALSREVLSASQRRTLLPGPPAGPDPYLELLGPALPDGTADTARLVSYAEMRGYMHDVLLRDTDQMSMAHGLEVRVPLLDHQLVQYVMGLPSPLKLLGAGPKPLLAAAVRDLLPAAVLERPKRGFTLPMDEWLHGPLRGLCERHLGRLAERGILRTEGIEALWRAFLDGRPSVTWSRVWVLVALDAWMDGSGIQTG